MKKSWANGERTMQYFRRVTYYTCVFDMAFVGACKCDHAPFPFRLVVYFIPQENVKQRCCLRTNKLIEWIKPLIVLSNFNYKPLQPL